MCLLSDPVLHEIVVVVVLGFYVPPTAKVIRSGDLGLKSHPKDWRSSVEIVYMFSIVYCLNQQMKKNNLISVSGSYMRNEPRHEHFAYAKTNTQISFAVTRKLISAFVFAMQIEQSLYLPNPKFQASSHLL